MEPIVIRIAKVEDVEGISYIIDYWVNMGIANEKQSGYLIRPVYDKEQLKDLAEGGYIIVAANNTEVCSFYLLNNHFHQELINQRSAIIQEKISNQQLPDGKYAYTLLASTHPNYLGQGLNTKTLNRLRDTYKKEYDYFIGIMGYDNLATHKSSLKMGWRHLGDVGIGLLAVIGTTEEKNILLDTYL